MKEYLKEISVRGIEFSSNVFDLSNISLDISYSVSSRDCFHIKSNKNRFCGFKFIIKNEK